MARLPIYLTTMLLSLLTATASLAQSPGVPGSGDFDRWGMTSWGWGSGHMMFGGIMMVVFWGGIILLVVLLARWIGSAGGSTDHSTGPQATGKGALDILKERFARGEIDEKEYVAKRRVLDKD